MLYIYFILYLYYVFILIYMFLFVPFESYTYWPQGFPTFLFSYHYSIWSKLITSSFFFIGPHFLYLDVEPFKNDPINLTVSVTFMLRIFSISYDRNFCVRFSSPVHYSTSLVQYIMILDKDYDLLLPRYGFLLGFFLHTRFIKKNSVSK